MEPVAARVGAGARVGTGVGGGGTGVSVGGGGVAVAVSTAVGAASCITVMTTDGAAPSSLLQAIRRTSSRLAQTDTRRWDGGRDIRLDHTGPSGGLA
jgi:hypothetical protein